MAGASDDLTALKSAVARQLELLGARQAEPGLYIVATPIGNLSDISLRALAILSAADVIFAEDTRHSARLLNHYAIATRSRPYHDHSSEAERAAVLDALAAGQVVALISDAGTPLISDPGYKLVQAAIAAGHDVISLPGASAVLPALTGSGLPSDAFLFAGFLPPKTVARIKRIEALRDVPATLVFYEAPGRVAATLADLADSLGLRDAVVARELTKQYEEIARAPLAQLAEQFAQRVSIKGECVIVVAPPVERGPVDDSDLVAALNSALKTATLRDAVRDVSSALDVPRGRVYKLAIALDKEPGSGAGA